MTIDRLKFPVDALKFPLPVGWPNMKGEQDMRKLTGSALIVLAVVLLVPALAFAKTACATIPQGGIVNSAGEVIEPGYDQWGYNYQARISTASTAIRTGTPPGARRTPMSSSR